MNEKIKWRAILTRHCALIFMQNHDCKLCTWTKQYKTSFSAIVNCVMLKHVESFKSLSNKNFNTVTCFCCNRWLLFSLLPPLLVLWDDKHSTNTSLRDFFITLSKTAEKISDYFELLEIEEAKHFTIRILFISILIPLFLLSVDLWCANLGCQIHNSKISIGACYILGGGATIDLSTMFATFAFKHGKLTHTK